jgi:hypothetical protein
MRTLGGAMKIPYSLLVVPAVVAALFVATNTDAERSNSGHLITFPNARGVAATFSTAGRIDTSNPFFQDLGTNGRSCGTCHLASDGWTVTPRASRHASMRRKDAIRSCGKTSVASKVRFFADSPRDRRFFTTVRPPILPQRSTSTASGSTSGLRIRSGKTWLHSCKRFRACVASEPSDGCSARDRHFFRLRPRHVFSEGTMTIHDTPNRSATMPKRGEKNVLANGICT